MRLLALLLIAGVGAAASAWGLNRGGRAARLGALAGIVALFGVTIAAFALRPGRIDAAGEPGAGHFAAPPRATPYLPLVVGGWGVGPHGGGGRAGDGHLRRAPRRHLVSPADRGAVGDRVAGAHRRGVAARRARPPARAPARDARRDGGRRHGPRGRRPRRRVRGG